MLKQELKKWDFQNKNKDNLSLSRIFIQKLNYVQNHLLSSAANDYLWMQEKNLQNEWQCT